MNGKKEVIHCICTTCCLSMSVCQFTYHRMFHSNLNHCLSFSFIRLYQCPSVLYTLGTYLTVTKHRRCLCSWLLWKIVFYFVFAFYLYRLFYRFFLYLIFLSFFTFAILFLFQFLPAFYPYIFY